MNKKITVISNDPKRPQLLLAVGGAVEVFAMITPERIILRGGKDQTMRQELVVTPRAEYPFKITEINAKNGGNIKYEMRTQETPEGQSYIIVVENTKANITTPCFYRRTVT